MGLGAALIMPATLSILANVFPPRERAKAIAIWAGLAGGGAAIGPVAGGFLLEHYWWGSVFLVNVPFIALALIAGRVLVPNSKNPLHERLDPVGALLSMAGLTALLYGLIEAPHYGWNSPETLFWGGLGLAIMAVFSAWELRSDHPMLNLRFFRRAKFATSCLAITTSFFAMFGLFFMMTQYLQLVLGYGAFEAGLRLLPTAFTLTFFATNSAKLVEKWGARRVVGLGLAVVAMGLLALASVDENSSYWLIIGCLMMTSAGMGMSAAPSTTGIMSSLPLGNAGVGSAVNDTTRELGGALGVAVLGSVVASHYTSAMGDVVGPLPAAAASAAKNSVGAALSIADGLPGAAGAQLAQAARHAYAEAMSMSLVVAAVVVMVASAAVRRNYPDEPLGTGAYGDHGHGGESQPLPPSANGAEAVPAANGQRGSAVPSAVAGTPESGT
jgi:EmrB/QacA subfamily drug resistance transporter